MSVDTRPAEPFGLSPSTPSSGHAPVLVLGSASIHVARFVRGLLSAGERVVVATHGALALDPHAALLEQIAIDLAVLSRSAQRRLREAILRWRPRVVHAHQANSVAWHAVRAGSASGVPVVVTLWGSDVLTLPQRSPLHRWMVRHALRGASAWTADARDLLVAAERIAAPGGPAERVWIPIGIDDAPPLPGIVRERRLLSCRLHKPLYRIDAIVRAFAAIAPRHPQWTLEVAGSGEQTGALHALAAELRIAERIEFSGQLASPELGRAYRRSAVFVSVPETDGTSVSLLEAMAAGCLPVLSDLPANREWVQDGRNGRLVEAMDALPQALEAAIAEFESGGWDREGRAINERLVDEHARFANNIRTFVALYDRVVQEAAT